MTPVAKIHYSRVWLDFAANKGWPLLQLDVNNDFLHGDLEEEIGISSIQIALRLRKRKVSDEEAPYGLKQSTQSPKKRGAWFERPSYDELCLYPQSIKNP